MTIFLAVDAVWLGLISPSFYQRHLGHLLNSTINWYAAALFYLIFIFGLAVFAIEPAVRHKSLRLAMIFGAIYGLVSYSTYDLTNHATLKDWPLIVTVVDMTWGIVLSSTVAFLSTWTLIRFGANRF